MDLNEADLREKMLATWDLLKESAEKYIADMKDDPPTRYAKLQMGRLSATYDTGVGAFVRLSALNPLSGRKVEVELHGS